MDVPRAFKIVSQLETDLSSSFKLAIFEDGLSSFELCPVEAGEVVGRHGSCVRQVADCEPCVSCTRLKSWRCAKDIAFVRYVMG